MLSPQRLLRRLASLFASPRLDAELDEELRFHLDMETAKRVRAGMSEAAARAEALRVFGGSRFRDETRDARGVRPLEDLLQDLRVGLRTIGNQRTYAAVAILTLAIGIGATTALGSAVYRVLLAPYPFADADRIVTLWETNTRTPASGGQPVSPGNYLDWKARGRSFELMAAAEPYSFDFIGTEGPERFNTTFVTEDFFTIQGLRPLIGRTFAKEEFEPGRDQVVLLTESVWRTRFGAERSLVGRTLVLDSVPRVVIGIMPEDAMSPFDAEMWAPKVFRPQERIARTSGYWQIVARLAPGVSIEQASAELSGIARQLAAEHPATNGTTGAAVVSLRDAIAGNARTSLLVLLGAVAFVMLIACVNVANLQLAEAIRRRRELAIRTAIGAGRGRLVRQLLTETMLVALVGCLAGLGVAYVGIGAIRSFSPSGLWQLQRLHMDAPALLLALLLAALAGLAIGVLPVAAAARVRLAESLAAGGRSDRGGLSRRRANRLLVVSEVALALVLLVGAGLLLRSLSMLTRTDRGFVTEGVLVTTVQAWSYYPTPAQRAEFVKQSVERLAAIPGIERVAMTSSLPLSWPIGFERSRVSIEGRVVPPGDEQPAVRVSAISPGYFDALRIPIEAGRVFSSTDLASSPLVAVVNRAFARRHFGDENPIGKRITMGFMSAPLAREIVGVVGDVRHEGLHAEPSPGVFIPHAQGSTGAIHFVTRVAGEPGAMERRVRSELAAINGAMPLTDVTTMSALVDQSLRERRFQLGLLSCFSITALLLSAIGIYGVMSRATNERTHEIGVRMAIGAHAGDVRWMVLRNGGGLAVVGILSGAVIALVLTRYMAGMLFGVTPLDPLTFGAAAGVLLAAAVLATWFPAWRASRVDPVVALRNE
jgi:putative ABC transport system permease protein